MINTHTKIIAAAAREMLAPLGFQQEGKSRLWIADRGFWLNVVEFSPSRWSRSTTLMNAAHWLWAGAEFMSFDEAIPSGAHAEFANKDQFSMAVNEVTKTASAKAQELDQRFSCFKDIGAFVIERARSSPDRMAPSWWGYEAGIACALLNQHEDAKFFLRGITDERVAKRVDQLLPLLDSPNDFRKKINELIDQERKRLKLKPLISSIF